MRYNVSFLLLLLLLQTGSSYTKFENSFWVWNCSVKSKIQVIAFARTRTLLLLNRKWKWKITKSPYYFFQFFLSATHFCLVTLYKYFCFVKKNIFFFCKFTIIKKWTTYQNSGKVGIIKMRTCTSSSFSVIWHED